jgi:uncharacterized protein involved in outer membrane biogenesis
LVASKTTKIALKVFFALTSFLFIILISVALYLSARPNNFIKILTAQVEENTGRKLMVREAEISLSLHPEIIINDVSLANVEWGSRDQMVTVKRLRIKVNLLAFLFGELSFDEIHIIAPEFHFEKNPQGQVNWDFLDVDLPIMNVDQLEIIEGQLFYKDVSERTFNFKIDHFHLQHFLQDALQNIELKVEHQGNHIEISGKTGDAKSWLKNELFALDLTIKSNDIQAKINGKIKRPRDLKGLDFNLNLKAESLSSFSWLTETKLPQIGYFTLSARLLDQENGFKLDNFSVDLGRANFSGPIEIKTTKSRPKIYAKLTVLNFDTADLSQDDNTGGQLKSFENKMEQGESALMFSDKPLPLGFFVKTDADVSLRAKEINLFAVPVQNLNLKLLLNNGILVINPITAKVADGSFMAEVIIDASSKVARVGANINANQVDLGDLLSALLGKAHLEGGKTDIDINISGQGNSTRAIASTLNGHVYAVTGEGMINYDLSMAGESIIFAVLQKMNPMKEKQETTDLDCIVVRFDIADGIATIDKSLAYQSETLKVLGNGTIDLNNEKINILLSSKSTVASFLQVKGSLDKPAIVMNPVKALQKGTSLWVAIMTGGMSMAAEIVYDHVTSEGSPCEIAKRDNSLIDKN